MAASPPIGRRCGPRPLAIVTAPGSGAGSVRRPQPRSGGRVGGGGGRRRAPGFPYFGTAGAGDHRRHVRVARAPGDRELRQRALRARRRPAGAAPPWRPRRRSVRSVSQPEPFRLRMAAGRDAVLVLAGEQARGERAPGRDAEPDVLVEAGVLLLDRCVDDRLYSGCSITGLCRWWRSAMSIARSRRRSTRTCPSRAPCRADHVVHRPHRLLDRRVRVGAVAVDEVDEVELKRFERASIA